MRKPMNRARIWLVACLAAFPAVGMAAGPEGGLDVNVTNAPEVVVKNVPLPIEDVDFPERRPVFAIEFVTIPNGSSSGDESPIFSVPEGKRLVVEQIFARVNTNGADDKRVRVNLNLGAPLNSATFQLPPPVLSSIGTNVHILTEQVKLYSEPGAEITVEAQRGPDTNGTDSVGVKIWGHLVDVFE